jgi:hypothetical protein
MTGFNSKRMMARDVEPLNEQIRGLAEQAGFVLWKNESYNSGDVIDWSSSYDNELKKFAELIIQECLNICEDMGDNGKDGHYCADKIVKTFRS